MEDERDKSEKQLGKGERGGGSKESGPCKILHHKFLSPFF